MPGRERERAILAQGPSGETSPSPALKLALGKTAQESGSGSMLQRGGTQSDPADPRPEEAPARRDDGAAPYQEHLREDAALPPRWEENKNEGKFVTVARTPRMQRTPDEERGRPPQKRTRPARTTTKARPATGTWGQDLPEMLGGARA